VKRECYIAYNFAAESKKKIPSKPVFIKAPRYNVGVLFLVIHIAQHDFLSGKPRYFREFNSC